MKKGKLFVIEGATDGVGKQTQTEKLYKRLKKENKTVKMVSFPNYKSQSSDMVKMYLNGEFGSDASAVNPFAANAFYAMDRYITYMKELKDFYEEGGIIVADRYTTSSMIHQGAKFNSTKEIDNYIQWQKKFEYGLLRIPKPDKILFLDLPLGLSEKLRQGRKNKISGSDNQDIHESDREHLKLAYQTSQYVADKENWHKINCCQKAKVRDIESIHEEIYKAIIEQVKNPV